MDKQFNWQKNPDVRSIALRIKFKFFLFFEAFYAMSVTCAFHKKLTNIFRVEITNVV